VRVAWQDLQRPPAECVCRRQWIQDTRAHMQQMDKALQDVEQGFTTVAIPGNAELQHDVEAARQQEQLALAKQDVALDKIHAAASRVADLGLGMMQELRVRPLCTLPDDASCITVCCMHAPSSAWRLRALQHSMEYAECRSVQLLHERRIVCCHRAPFSRNSGACSTTLSWCAVTAPVTAHLSQRGVPFSQQQLLDLSGNIAATS
jgi:hypothetical protein